MRFKRKRGIAMAECGISKLDLKRRNRMQVLMTVRERGPISRVDIAEHLRITRAAVTIITNEMIDQGILEEVGEEPADRNGSVRKGRRKILLDINETYRFVLGIYVDETEICMGLTTLNSAALEKRSIPYDGELTIPLLVEMILDNTRKMLGTSCLEPVSLLSIGMGIMPAVAEQLGGELTPEGGMVFSELQKAMQEKSHVPVYCNSAILEFAMAGVSYGKSHLQTVNHVFLYCDEEGQICAVPMHGSDLLPGATWGGQEIHQLRVGSTGNRQEGEHGVGSVGETLSPQAIQAAVAPVFSEEQTPTLWKQLEGDLSQLTLAALLTAAETDTDVILEPAVEVLLQRFVAMLHALYCLYFAEYLCLYQFGFTEENLVQIRQAAEVFAGKAFADAILLSPVQERCRFLCGCTYAIQEGFFRRGGMVGLEGEDMNGKNGKKGKGKRS